MKRAARSGMATRDSLSPREEEQVQELAAARAHLIHEVARREGEEELDRPVSALGWSGLSAGLSVGLSLMMEGLLAAEVAGGRAAHLVYSLGYPLGFLASILGRQQLFTENTLTPVVPFLSKPEKKTFRKIMRLWGIVLLTNILGAAAAGFACSIKALFPGEVRAQFLQISAHAFHQPFGGIFLKAIVAGWVIALLTWLLSGVEVGEVALIFLLTYFIGLGGYSHVVVGSATSGYLISQHAASIGECLGHYLLPTLLGNVVGGVGLVALLNHAQVVSGRRHGR